MTSQQNFQITYKATSSLTPYPANARMHSKEQVRQIVKSIECFGFTNPVLVSDDEIIAGHGRVRAAKLIGMETVPTLMLSYLSETERRAYVIAVFVVRASSAILYACLFHWTKPIRFDRCAMKDGILLVVGKSRYDLFQSVPNSGVGAGLPINREITLS